MIVQNTTKDLIATVHNFSTGAPVAAGTIYAVVRLESGDADDGKYWDGDSWETTPGAYPTAAHLEAGQWLYTLPAGATTGKEGSTVRYTFTDNLDEGLATTVCGGGEHRVTEFTVDDVRNRIG